MAATNSSLLLLLCALPVLCQSKQPVTIQVDAAKAIGPLEPVWDYFGYDEANYTYQENGRKLIGELAALADVPTHFRTHFLLATGNGGPALKWGATNAYLVDSSGKPVYNWTIVDRIFGTYLQAGGKPYVEVGFMPKALSSHPEPYQPHWKPGEGFNHYSLGWAYPPKDYRKWSELIYRWIKHSVAKYGKGEVASWDWEVWNEPDIGYWRGTPEEYDKLYDYTAAAVKRALPATHVGGPASTGPDNPRAAAFLRQFLEHCGSGRNYVTGQKGAPLDFISFHAKGQPALLHGHVRMGLSKEMKDVAEGFKIVRSFSQFKDLPIVISEADPEGCAACSAEVYPPNAYRNGTLYPAYQAAALKSILQLAATSHANLRGVLTWAFEFENQPYFAGFRALATNGIDKPVLNFFRMAGLMQGDIVKAASSGAVPVETILNAGVSGHADVDALAARAGHNLSVLVWNYQDLDVSGPAALVDLKVSGLSANAKRVLVRHYRIDRQHSNAYTAWKQMGSPRYPTPAQYKKLEAAGQLQLLSSPRWIDERSGSVELRFALPLRGLALLQLSW